MINWEERRYEIAKDIVVKNFEKLYDKQYKGLRARDLINSSLNVADMLIKELKNNKL